MYHNKKTAPITVRDYIKFVSEAYDPISFEKVKDKINFGYGSNFESDDEYDAAEELFDEKMKTFSLDTLISEIVSYKGEGIGGLYFADDLDEFPVYRGKFIN